MCPVSCVMCHVSRVTCHLSPVTGHMSKYIFLNIFFIQKKTKKWRGKKIGQSGGANRRRVCYQRGLPRLVFKCVDFVSIYFVSS